MLKIIYCIIAAALLMTNISGLAQQGPVITEFLASNKTILQDEDGDYPDWIEIYNDSDVELSLLGWYLTDEEDSLTKWAFPEISMAAHEFLIVFASGKDRSAEKEHLHTNFKLSGSGEYLALVYPGNPGTGTTFAPAYPEQFVNVSYGALDGINQYFAVPTPGYANTESDFLLPPQFSVVHGHFFDPFNLEITSSNPDALIYYTTDASTPSPENGILFSGPLTVSTTTIIRAVVIEGDRMSTTVTQTFIFPEDVLSQPEFPAGYPEEWIRPINGTDDHEPIQSEYGVYPHVTQDPAAEPYLVPSLLGLPVVSIVSDIDNFFSSSTHPDSGGIYMYTGAPDGPTVNQEYHLGRDWIRAGSVEYFNGRKEEVDFQANCGIELHGGASRTPWKTGKHSFKLGFKSEYGPSKLRQDIFEKGAAEQFEWLILRGGFAQRYGLELYDPWMKTAFRDMGHYAAYSQFVHVYLNGLYWGIYNLCERMDKYTMSNYFGGEPNDYDIIKDYYEVGAGDSLAWEKLVQFVKEEIAEPENYQRLLGNNPDGTPNALFDVMLDVENLADYILLNYYIGNTDWDRHNWFGIRRRTDSEGFKFLPWDGEYIFRDAYIDVTNTDLDYRPSGIFNDLLTNNEFRQFFRSRVNKHMFGDGALTPNAGHRRYSDWFGVIDTVILMESARWNSTETPKPDIWETSYHSFIDSYFPVRTDAVLGQLMGKDLYPMVGPPVFNTSQINLDPDFELFMNTTTGGEIFYTLDGSDPGCAEEENSGSVILYDGNPLPLTADTIDIRARVNQDGYWSRLSKRLFYIDREEPPSSTFTVLSESITGLKAYPNPASSELTLYFSISESDHVRIELYNTMGEQIAILLDGVYPAGESNKVLRVESLPRGVYILVLSTLNQEENIHSKIILE